MATAERTPWGSGGRPAPFCCVEDAWFWTVSAMRARHTGSNKGDHPKVTRPCDPDDVLKCLDRLYRGRRINLDHARVLRKWGEQQMTPHSVRSGGTDPQLWREAMDRLGQALRHKGIVL